MSLGSAGESGSKITGDVEKFLIDGFLPTIGIECHVQLNTKTKLFSSVDNDARDAEPNSKVSAIDYALPGMLPYLNREAIRLAARAGKALNAKIANQSHFDRKHYFYPDLPKGYQISQMYEPIILGGEVKLPSGEIVRIHHAHLEEDAGKLTHKSEFSLVDLNRAGTPLIEIVAEPDIHSAASARAYAEELQLLMVYAGVTNGELYYGNMRFDVNISVAKPGAKLGIRTEIKNLNSFRSVERAVEYEITRQIDLLNQGEEIVQETRGWNDDRGETTTQRSKENAQDYRYMPDPDIPPVILTDQEIAKLQENMPTLPGELREKFAKFKIDQQIIEKILKQKPIADLILALADVEENSRKKTLEESSVPADFAAKYDHLVRRIFNLFASTPEEEMEIARIENGEITPRALLNLAYLAEDEKVSSSAAKEIFLALFSEENLEKMPHEIAKNKNLLQNSDAGEIAAIVDEVLANPASAQAISDIKNGQEKAIGFLVGHVMKLSRGQANPGLAQKVIREKILSE